MSDSLRLRDTAELVFTKNSTRQSKLDENCSNFLTRIPGYRTSFFEVLKRLSNDAGVNYRIIAPAEINDIRNDVEPSNPSTGIIETLKFKFLKHEIDLFNPKK